MRRLSLRVQGCRGASGGILVHKHIKSSQCLREGRLHPPRPAEHLLSKRQHKEQMRAQCTYTKIKAALYFQCMSKSSYGQLVTVVECRSGHHYAICIAGHNAVCCSQYFLMMSFSMHVIKWGDYINCALKGRVEQRDEMR
eukprot:scaffold249950_cov19-Prasinocladus_malaysianus.AAC.1